MLVDFLAETNLQGLLIDSAGRIIYANPHAQALLGLPERPPESTKLDSILSPRNPEWLSREIRKCGAQDGWAGDAILNSPEGDEKWIHIQACRAPGGNSGKLLLLVEDATERVSTTNTLKEHADELHGRYWGLDLLNRIGRLTLANRSLEHRLRGMLREAAENIGVHCAGVFVKCDDAPRLVCRCLWGDLPGASAEALSVDINDETVTGRAVLTRQTVMSRFFADEPEPVKSVLTKFGIKSVVSAPILAGDEALGALILGDNRRTRSFTLPEVRLLEIVANCAASALRDDLLADRIRRLESEAGDVRETLAQSSVRETTETVIGLCGIHPASRGRVIADLVPEGIPNVEAHPTELRDVLLNLILNAIQATKPGGVVSVEAEFHEADESVDVRVVDDGCGMSPEVIEHAFEPFFSTKGADGLGLYVSTEAVRRMGGCMIVDSRPGEGTVFTVRLNAAKHQQTAQQQKAA